MSHPSPDGDHATAIAAVTRRPGEVLDEREVLALMRGCSTRAPTGIRNGALIAVMWRTGLRLGEALALAPGDVDARQGTIVVRRPKGATTQRSDGTVTTIPPRKVGIDLDALERVEWWRQRRGELSLPPRAPLFCTLHGGALDQAYVRRVLRRLAAKPARRPYPGEDPATIPPAVSRRVHPHALRHSFAHDAYRSGFDVAEVQQALGHRHTRTTYGYLRQVAPDVVERMRQRRWSDSDDDRGA